MKVPTDCITAPDALTASWDSVHHAALHVALPFGEPAPWRSAAAAWEQIGDFNPAAVEIATKNRSSNTKREKQKIAPRSIPATGLIKTSFKDAIKLRGYVSATAFAVATVRGCRFPIGDTKDSDFHFCNARRTHGSYCECHSRMVAL